MSKNQHYFKLKVNASVLIAFTELKYFTNLETIKPYAFSQCTSLWKINFPESLKVIGAGAFNRCTSLLNVTIPQSVNTIESSTFADCNNIKTLTIESNELLTIGDNAFYRCGGILNINCDIPSNSFSSSYFTEVIVGDKVTTIGTEAFAYCDSLSSVSFGSNVLEISQKAFRSCVQLRSVIIPDKVTTIGTEAFAYCNSLCELTIGSSVTKIGGSAFMTSNYSNNPLLTVYIKALTPPSIGAYALYVTSGLNSSNTYYYKVPSNMKIYVPTSSVYTYKSQWTNYADNIVGYTF